MEIATEIGVLAIEPYDDGRLRLTATPASAATFINRRTILTRYPLELVREILRVKGLRYVCDEIARDEDPRYLEWDFATGLFAFLPQERLAGLRLLDFGCGSGSSTMILSRLLPQTEIVGVELDADLLAIARARARFYGFPAERLMQSPSGNALPDGIGAFDVIVLHAVYEHLLPDERDDIMRLLWGRLRPGGCLIIDSTPYRWNLVETHTTGLPLINFLPRTLAHWAACRFSRRIGRAETWQGLLRMGIRGGSAGEILGRIRAGGGAPVPVSPAAAGARDRVDLWLRRSQGVRPSSAKTLAYYAYKALHATTGVVMVPDVTLAIRKEE